MCGSKYKKIHTRSLWLEREPSNECGTSLRLHTSFLSQQLKNVHAREISLHSAESKRWVLHQRPKDAGIFSQLSRAHTYTLYNTPKAAGCEKNTVQFVWKKGLVKHAWQLNDNFSCGILPKVFALAKVKEGFSMLRVDIRLRAVLKALVAWDHSLPFSAFCAAIWALQVLARMYVD